MARFWLTGIVLLLALGLMACGGGGPHGGVATPGAPETTAPTGEATPGEGFTITDNLFESEEKGYNVRIPEGWSPRPNFFPGPGFSVDAFFAPDLVEGVQPNISIACDQIPEGTTLTLKEYSDAKLQAARGVAQVEPDVSSGEVGGQEAVVARYKREKLEPAVEKTEFLFVTAKCGWDITLTVPLGRGSDYQNLFEEFLNSFRLLP